MRAGLKRAKAAASAAKGRCSVMASGPCMSFTRSLGSGYVLGEFEAGDAPVQGRPTNAEQAAVHDVLQLANVAGPMVTAERFERFGRDALHLATDVFAEALQEVPDQ